MDLKTYTGFDTAEGAEDCMDRAEFFPKSKPEPSLYGTPNRKQRRADAAADRKGRRRVNSMKVVSKVEGIEWKMHKHYRFDTKTGAITVIEIPEGVETVVHPETGKDG